MAVYCEARVVAQGTAGAYSLYKYIVKTSPCPSIYYWYDGLTGGDSLEKKDAVISSYNTIILMSQEDAGLKYAQYSLNEEGDILVQYSNATEYLEKNNIRYLQFMRTIRDYKINVIGIGQWPVKENRKNYLVTKDGYLKILPSSKSKDLLMHSKGETIISWAETKDWIQGRKADTTMDVVFTSLKDYEDYYLSNTGWLPKNAVEETQ